MKYGNIFRCSILISALLICFASLLSSVNLAETTKGGIPNAAKRAADKYLARLADRVSRGQSTSERIWNLDHPIDMHSSYYGDPYLILTLDRDGLQKLLEADDADLLACTKILQYAFPIYNQGTFIGTVLVAENRARGENGNSENQDEYIGIGRQYRDNPVDGLIMSLGKDYDKKKGYDIAFLQSHYIGCYVLVVSNNRLYRVAPFDRISKRILQANDDQAPSKETILRLKEAARNIIDNSQ